MPLSEDEQRILREIEANLSVTDPKLVQQVSDTTLYRHATRMIKWSVLGFVAGLVLLLATFTSVLALGVARVPRHAVLPARDRAQRPQDGPGRAREPHRRRCGAARSRACSASAGKRWRERWQRDDDQQ